MECKEFMEPAEEGELPEVEPYDRDVNLYEWLRELSTVSDRQFRGGYKKMNLLRDKLLR